MDHRVGLWSKDISKDAQTDVGKVAAAIWVPRLWGHEMTLILAFKYRAVRPSLTLYPRKS